MTQTKEPPTFATQPDIAAVRRFWEANPLCALESPYPAGSREFFEWHDRVRETDVEVFAMHLYEFDQHAGERVLDVGCGVGWLCRHFAAGGAEITGVDITYQATKLTRKRCELHELPCTVVQGSAEQLPFDSGSYDFVTSAGVLHHTPDTARSVDEIFRVLRPGGRAMISLYYKSWLISPVLWPIIQFFVQTLLGGWAGRASLRRVQSADDFVRIYDGDENPIGKSYSRSEIEQLFAMFEIERVETHYFPRRLMPFSRFIPLWIHRLMDRYGGLMIYATLRKPQG